MASPTYSDKEISHNEQVFFLVVAEFVIKVIFGSSELGFFKKRLLKEFLEIWGKGGFLRKSTGKFDFVISFVPKTQIGIVRREKGKEEYHLAFKKDFSNRRLTTYYYQGLLSFQLALKEVLAYLLERNNGLLLHASSCLDKKENLKVFFAPSGGGKTTTASMLLKGGYKLFGDDLLVVRKLGGRWRYFSPPFVEKNLMPKKQEKSAAKLFFINKAKLFAKEEIIDKGKVLKLVLGQLWLREGEVGEKLFKNALDFVKENKFYKLSTKLDPKGLRKVLDEN